MESVIWHLYVVHIMIESDYHGVGLPAGFVQQVENLFEKLEKEGFDHGYKTMAEFARDAVRRRVEEFRQIYFLGERNRR